MIKSKALPRLIRAGLLTGALAGMSATPAAANEPAAANARNGGPAQNQAETPTDLTRFAPADDLRDHQIDYGYFDDALSWFVIPMGPSIRQTPGRFEPELGTRRIYGHESRFRLEGNRVAFSFLSPEIIASLSEYRADLERIGSELAINRIPRNEQLAFWLNLHNVALIEALAKAYPIPEPLEGTYGPDGESLDDASLVRIDGTDLSLRDIREGIVYANWRDAKVMYGFWRGVIGGPSIQRLAYTGNNVDALLSLSAEEFVNSLRGVSGVGRALEVSPIYAETQPFFFSDKGALRTHLAQYAGEDVEKLLAKKPETRFSRLQTDLADLARAEKDPALNYVVTNEGGSVGGNGLTVDQTLSLPRSTRPNPAIHRLMDERRVKLNRAHRRGIRTGMVIYGDTGGPSNAEAREVK